MPEITRYLMRAAGEPFLAERAPAPPLAPGEVLVEVAGCGVCHTDLGFYFDGVRTRRPAPLCLGHEISGFVTAAGADATRLLGQAVIVPAVLPCGTCPLCTSGGACICPTQMMPGNDVHGGFASHVVVPARWLCPIPGCTGPDQELGAAGVTLRELAVVADAVSTPFQALERSGLAAGELAIVVGAGGIGGYAVQLAAARGATVAALDVDPARLEAAGAAGAALALDVRGKDPKEVRKAVRELVKSRGLPDTRWKIFECSGTPAGQQTAWSLLVHGAALSVVGFAKQPVELKLSNLMAFDATARGNWGCDPALYPRVLELVLAGAVRVAPHVELRPLSSIDHAFRDVHDGKARRRIVLVPDGKGSP